MTTMLTECLRVVDASVGVQSRNILLFVDSCAAKHTMCVLSTKLHKHDAFYKDWIWLDAELGVDFSSDTSVDNEMATRGSSSLDKFCDVCEGGKGGGRGRQM